MEYLKIYLRMLKLYTYSDDVNIVIHDHENCKVLETSQIK